MRNHQDKYFFFINIACRNDANLIKWLHDSIFANFEHLVSLFTLFRNNLLGACQELSRNSHIKVERMSRLKPRDLERQLIQNGEPDAWDEHNRAHDKCAFIHGMGVGVRPGNDGL